MKKIIFLSLIMSLFFVPKANAQNYAGQQMPDEKPIKQLESKNIETIDGKVIQIGKGSKKPVLLILFATWCPHCEKALPQFEKQFAGLQDKITFLGVGYKHSKKHLKEYLKKTKFTFQFAADEDNTIYSYFAYKYVPRIYLMDKKGNIVFKEVGWSKEQMPKLVKAVNKLIK